MDLISLILYAVLNLAMILSCLAGERGRFYELPFWMGTISLGFFFTQATGGYRMVDIFPGNAYTTGMLFALLCNAALWVGFVLARDRGWREKSWLAAEFDVRKLYYAGVILSLIGFFFQWKLWSLPAEMLERGVWTGPTVKYNFFATLFKLGFITLWCIYLSERKKLNISLLVFIVPSLTLLFVDAAFRGRRTEMMNMCAYILVSLWFVRRILVPRWLLVTALFGGLILINSIGLYRSIIMNEEQTLSERLVEASRADYAQASRSAMHESSVEFKNYIFFRYVQEHEAMYDYGLWHWNGLVSDFVPAQILGSEFKKSLMYKPDEFDKVQDIARSRYGHKKAPTSTITGYADAYGSFGWLGFLKFGLIGWIMGRLYSHAMGGRFLGQVLYVYLLSDAMLAITHQTNVILMSRWIYFFAMAYPFFYLARLPHNVSADEYDPPAGGHAGMVDP